MKRIALASFACLTSLVTLFACGGGSSDNTCSASGQALSVCAKGKVTKGVDVSIYQGTVDWAKAHAAGVEFGIARVSDGTGNPDTQFDANWKNLKKEGLVRGLYQFYRPNEDAVKQADLMLSMLKTAGGLETGDLPPIMDIEVTGGLSPSQIQASMKTWLDYVEKQTGRKPMIYTAAFMSSNVGTGFSKYPLWVANYGPTCPTMPSGWSDWVFWQYSDNAMYNGIGGGADGDEFNGTLADLIAWADGPQPPDAGAPDSGSHDAGREASAPPPTSDGGSTPAPTPSASSNPCP